MGELGVMKDSDFYKKIENELIANVVLQSHNQNDPIEVKRTPKNWRCIGVGNYAAVFINELKENVVVKVYARDINGLKKEAEVYEKLGKHPSYSYLIHKGQNYLVLKRLEGITLYDAILKGIRIPESVIKDINDALKYAKGKGLNPFDVHGKNVMMKDGKGFVVDVSDFYKEGKDQKWEDLVKAYYKIYIKTLYKYPLKVQPKLLDKVRHLYRFYKKVKSFNK